MKLILISGEKNIEGEFDLVNKLFDEGLEIFHLRKPSYSFEEMEVALRSINPQYLRRTVVHSHFELIKKYNLGGFHLPSYFLKETDGDKAKEIMKQANKRGLSTSTSVHTLEEVAKVRNFEYFFISPVFTSISKPGYSASLNLDKIESFLIDIKDKVASFPEAIALGGISEHNVEKIKKPGFDGVAILGTIWQDFDPGFMDSSLGKFRNFQKLMQHEQ